jgi:hypothetical protein
VDSVHGAADNARLDSIVADGQGPLELGLAAALGHGASPHKGENGEGDTMKPMGCSPELQRR